VRHVARAAAVGAVFRVNADLTFFIVLAVCRGVAERCWPEEALTMLKHRLIHPQINAVLAQAGHHAKVLIADGNYPASTKRGPAAQLVSLNLMPGVITCRQALEAVLSAVPIDAAQTMMYTPDDPYTLDRDPPVWDEYRQVLGAAGLELELEPIAKWDFYKAVETSDHVLTIQTGDQQRFANLLLSIGVRMD
jgi:L-fucose mutarotase